MKNGKKVSKKTNHPIIDLDRPRLNIRDLDHIQNVSGAIISSAKVG